eukprot:353478-Chlamydomonas_euryale.AAC.10
MDSRLWGQFFVKVRQSMPLAGRCWPSACSGCYPTPACMLVPTYLCEVLPHTSVHAGTHLPMR